MRVRPALVLLLTLTLLAGCGSDDDEQDGAAQTQPPQTQAQEPVSDETQVRDVASRYLEAYAERDWEGVCATLSPRARARYAREAGSCPAVYRGSRVDSSARSLRVQRVHLVGRHRAVVDVSRGGSLEQQVALRMYAARIDGEWFLDIRR